MKEYKFEVETIEAGQRGKYQDSYYAFKVTSKHPEHIVKDFCMGVLRKSYQTDKMPSAFHGQLLEFKKLTLNNEGKAPFDDREDETYSYKTKELYTG